MAEVERIELYVDGGSRGNPGPAASAYVIKRSSGETVKAKGFHLGHSTNNVAEYTALLRGLEAIMTLGVRELDIYSDSELMVKQIIGEYRVRSQDLMELFEQVQRKLLNFDRWQIKHIRREFNKEADRLVNETLDFGDEIDEPEESLEISEEPPKPKKAAPKTSKKAKKQTVSAIPVVPRKILAEVITISGEQGCENPMQAGQCFVFSQCVPAGLCVHAAMSLLPIVLEMQNDPSAESPREVSCSKPGCSVKFKLSII
jgi:uncharacterized repeat protein (TIGR04076 family)